MPNTFRMCSVQDQIKRDPRLTRNKPRIKPAETPVIGSEGLNIIRFNKWIITGLRKCYNRKHEL